MLLKYFNNIKGFESSLSPFFFCFALPLMNVKLFSFMIENISLAGAVRRNNNKYEKKRRNVSIEVFASVAWNVLVHCVVLINKRPKNQAVVRCLINGNLPARQDAGRRYVCILQNKGEMTIYCGRDSVSASANCALQESKISIVYKVNISVSL